MDYQSVLTRAGARTLIGGGGGGRVGCIFIYSGYARLIPFEINFITKENSRAESEYMNIHPPPPVSVLAPALVLTLPGSSGSAVKLYTDTDSF